MHAHLFPVKISACQTFLLLVSFFSLHFYTQFIYAECTFSTYCFVMCEDINENKSNSSGELRLCTGIYHINESSEIKSQLLLFGQYIILLFYSPCRYKALKYLKQMRGSLLLRHKVKLKNTCSTPLTTHI